MVEDWDLSAVVRSCTAATYTITTSNIYINTADSANQNIHFENPLECSSTFTGDDFDLFSFPDLLHSTNNGRQELQDSYKPFLPTTAHQSNILGSSFLDFVGVSAQNQPPPPLPAVVPPPTTDIPFTQQQEKLHQQDRSYPDASTSELPLRTLQPQAPSRPKKKKNHQKKQVMQVTAVDLCNDVWAWRKYGQKPIKGSPYPRNYYRCSSSKGCLARKQVERNKDDPTMFTVSFTGEHAHPRPTYRNSLAGSTRPKFPATIQNPTASTESTAAPSGEKGSSLSVKILSPTTPLAAPTDHDAPNENMNSVAENINEADLELESDADGAGDGDGGEDCIHYEDYDDILIPNTVFNEDLIKGFQELGSIVGGSGGSTRNGGFRS